MNRSRIIRKCALESSTQGGFTLIEMLVAVTLVLLMMVMFGEIFQIASGSVTKQRVMADNDQNSRTFVTVIRGDLDKRSFRDVVPFYPNEPVDEGTPFSTRRGYFYISTNNPDDGTDDVLQFTMDANVKSQNADTSQFFGRALILPQSLRSPAVSDSARRTQFLQDTNQPERDDGQITPNEAGASSAAEIAYWMRGGNLYRRVMLLREPVSADDDPQPQGANNNFFFLPQSNYVNEDTNGNGRRDSGEDANGNGVLDGNVWGEFDYSAHKSPFVAAGSGYAVFNGTDYLLNSSPPLTGAPARWTPSLGQPWNRFGFYLPNPIAVNSLTNGLPREFTSAAGSSQFIGRFTQQETSDARFLYPHRLSYSASGPGFDPMDAGNTLTLNNNGLINQFNLGNRAGVDLLLTHVHEFRVEVWDERLNDFAPIGHSRTNASGVNGDYHSARRWNSTYGPLGGTFNVFDTWHPQFDRNNDGVWGDVADQPPFRPLNWNPQGTSGVQPPNANRFWTPNTTYNVGDVVFPRTEDENGNGFLDAGEDGSNGFPMNGILDRRLTEDANGNNILNPGEDGTYGFPPDGGINSTNPPFFPFGLTYSYRCVRGGTSGPWSSNEPSWHTSPGTIIAGIHEDVNGNGALDLGEDRDSDGLIDPNEDTFGNNNGILEPWEDLDADGNNDRRPDEPDWLIEYNCRPLRAIRITVRFEHPTSKQMKQVTIVHSLRDTTTVQ